MVATISNRAQALQMLDILGRVIDDAARAQWKEREAGSTSVPPSTLKAKEAAKIINALRVFLNHGDTQSADHSDQSHLTIRLSKGKAPATKKDRIERKRR